jgi:hypothetical protein
VETIELGRQNAVEVVEFKGASGLGVGLGRDAILIHPSSNHPLVVLHLTRARAEQFVGSIGKGVATVRADPGRRSDISFDERHIDMLLGWDDDDDGLMMIRKRGLLTVSENKSGGVLRNCEGPVLGVRNQPRKWDVSL